jgi:hypothetical protein
MRSFEEDAISGTARALEPSWGQCPHGRSRAPATGIGACEDASIAGELSARDETIEHALTRAGIHTEQPRRLRERESQTWHLAKFSRDA